MKFDFRRVAGLVCAVATMVLAVGCATKEKPEGPEVGEDYFEIIVGTVTHNSAPVTVKASDELPVDWYWGVATADVGETVLDTNDVAALMDESWHLMIDYYETTEQEYPYLEFAASVMLPAGSEDSYLFDFLEPSTDYIAWACGFNGSGKPVGKVACYNFTTKAVAFESVECYNYGDFYGNGTTNFLIDFYPSENEVYTFDLIAPANSVTPVGEYSVGGSKYAIVEGDVEEDEEGSYLVGSYYGSMDDEGYFEEFFFITGGTVSIKRESAKYVIKVRCTDDYDRAVEFDYTGDFEIMDATEEYAAGIGGQSRVVARQHFGKVAAEHKSASPLRSVVR